MGCEEYEELRLKTGEITTMDDLMKEFSAKGIFSTPVEDVKIFLNRTELDRNGTVYDLDLIGGTELEIVLST